MRFYLLVETLTLLEKTASRNLMTEILAEFLKSVDETEIKMAVYLLLGQLGPMYFRIDFGLADKMIVRAIALASSKKNGDITKSFKSLGDLGLVAFEEIKNKQISQLEIEEVYQWLKQIAAENGKGSQDVKIELTAELLKKLSGEEQKYVVRIILGKMRLGFSDKTILDALAVMNGGNKVGRTNLEMAYQVFPDIGMIAYVVKSKGLAKINESIKLEVGVPVMPALAQRLKTPDEMIEKMGKVLVEPKFDGQRIQIHYDKKLKLIKTYARSLEENSAMFPELTQAITQIQAENIILDCEAVGFDPKTGVTLPFQETITRKRKHGVLAASLEIPLKFYCFDVLYKNGVSLLSKPLYVRREILKESILGEDILVVDESIETDDATELRLYHKKQLSLGFEGALVKKYDGEYQPGRTGWNWVKFKEVEEARGKLKDTVDGVVMGYYRGKGKRSAFGIGAFLLGIWDDEAEIFKSVAKIGTGLSDDLWREMKQQVDSHFSIAKPSQYEVANNLKPDIWADPVIVVEIAADEITKSPLHTSGFGLRFPRLVRFREDKKVNQVTTIKELATI